MASSSCPLWESRFWQRLPTRISRFTTSITLPYTNRCLDNTFKSMPPLRDIFSWLLLFKDALILHDIFSWQLILRHPSATTWSTTTTRVTTNQFD
jgi:hypothetical protein